MEADLYRYDWTGLGEQVVAWRPDVVFLASAIPAALIDAVYAMDQSGYRGLYYFAYGALMTMVRARLSNPEVATRFRSHDLALPPSPHLDRFLSLYEDAYGAAFVPEPRLIAFADYLALLSLAVAQVGDGSPERVAAAMKQIAGPPGEAFGALDYAAAVSALEQGRDIDFMGPVGPVGLRRTRRGLGRVRRRVRHRRDGRGRRHPLTSTPSAFLLATAGAGPILPACTATPSLMPCGKTSPP